MGHRQRIQEFKAWLYGQWLLKYPLKCAPGIHADAHFVDVSTRNERHVRGQGRAGSLRISLGYYLDENDSHGNRCPIKVSNYA